MSRTVLFVCPHGAAKSRMAAAYFNLASPPDWTATSAGLDPGPELSPTARRLLAGTDAEPHLDPAPPRTIPAAGTPDRIVAIDCDVPTATRWDLAHQDFDATMRDEIRARTAALAAELDTQSSDD